MNYAEARQLDDKSGWHFTVKNDNRVWAYHCCREPGSPATGQDVALYGYELGEPTTGKPHAPHPTKEEAEACFNKWRRNPDHVSLDSSFRDWTGCTICDAPTKKAARVKDIGGSTHVALCDEHLTIELAISTIRDITSATYS